MINVTKTFLPPQGEYNAILKKAWDAGWITNRGALVLELEEKLKAYLKVPNILAMTNGTLPLQIAIKALGLKGEIVTTPFSYVATTSSIVWEGCTPVFVDIHPEYLTIDETKIEAAITSKTTAILATHVFGNPCAVDEIEAIAKKHNLKVIYDAAHCFGVTYKDKSIFEYGDVSTCSFHATKVFHTGEGGALFTDSSELNDKLFYHHNFENLGSLRIREGTQWNHSYYPVLFKDETQLLHIQKLLNQKKIYPRRYFYPSLNLLPYVDKKICPISENIASRVLCLPLYHDLAEVDVLKICTIINEGL